MSRDGRDDPSREEENSARPETARQHNIPTQAIDCDRDPGGSRPWSAGRDLTLPHTQERQPVTLGHDRYRLRDSESEILATVGVFRVVPERDLLRSDAQAEGDLRSLSGQGLVETHGLVINHHPERVVVLTDAGKDLLDQARDEADRQQYYAGLVKPREAAHDAQLHRLFEVEREKLEEEGSRVTRVVLDYELKRDYQRFLHEQQAAGVDADTARRAFAEAQGLSVSRGHIELPDVRIEYETPDGREEHRDLELATEHYSRAQLAGKHNAGFRVYRAGGARGAGSTKPGGTPGDPDHLEWLR